MESFSVIHRNNETLRGARGRINHSMESPEKGDSEDSARDTQASLISHAHWTRWIRSVRVYDQSCARRRKASAASNDAEVVMGRKNLSTELSLQDRMQLYAPVKDIGLIHSRMHGLAHQLSYVTATSSLDLLITNRDHRQLVRAEDSPIRFLTLLALPRYNIVDRSSCRSINGQVHRSEADLVHHQKCRPTWQVSSLSLATMTLTGAVCGIEDIKGDHRQQIDRMPEIG
ncbi:hypothetical protein C8Q74DRAFT_665358 [Fomes fomentarius]|nr:hypothetical protein C8Q74DRAFT_665358 [Fomes fomentarius]